MHHLHYVIAFTGRLDAMRRFYERGLQLPVRRAEPDWVEFDTAGASFALHRMDDPGRQGQMLRFVTGDLDASLAELRGRGLTPVGDLIEFQGGRIAAFFDADRNYIQIIQPAHPAPSGGGPSLPMVILNVDDVAAATAFYRDRLAIHVAHESATSCDLDTGATHLSLRARAMAGGGLRHGTQPVVLGFDVPSLEELGRELAERGLVFTAGPVELAVGRGAEVTDPDGHRVFFRCTEPVEMPELALAADDDLAEEWEDDAPTRDAMRKPGTKRAKATSRVAVKPKYRAKKSPRAARSKHPAKSARVRTNTRLSAKPATGRLKKAERKSATRKKAALASASRSKPVKRASAKRSKPARATRSRSSRSRGR